MFWVWGRELLGEFGGSCVDAIKMQSQLNAEVQGFQGRRSLVFVVWACLGALEVIRFGEIGWVFGSFGVTVGPSGFCWVSGCTELLHCPARQYLGEGISSPGPQFRFKKTYKALSTDQRVGAELRTLGHSVQAFCRSVWGCHGAICRRPHMMA